MSLFLKWTSLRQHTSAPIGFIPQRAPGNSQAVSRLTQLFIPNQVFTDPIDQQDKICKVALEKIQKGDLDLHQAI